MIGITCNGIRVTDARFVLPWTGIWFAELTLDPEPYEVAPSSGSVAVVVQDAVLLGTVDSRASGSFAETRRIRVLGGNGGWHKKVRKQQFHNDAGVLFALVASSTAAEVGEVVAPATVETLGPDYMRRAGPAAQIFGRRSWYVTPQGVTVIGDRIPVPADPTAVELLNFDPTTRIAELFSSSGLVWPGSIVIDPRVGEPLTLGDVECTFSANGMRASAMTGGDRGRAQVALDIQSDRATDPYGASYTYRIILKEAGRYHLQAVRSVPGIPDALAIRAWPGMAGLSCEPKPGAEVKIQFTEGSPSYPYLMAFEPEDGPGHAPLVLNIAAEVLVAVCAEGAGIMAVGPAPQKPVALAPDVVLALQAIVASLQTLGATLSGMAGPLTGPAAGGAVTTAANQAAAQLASIAPQIPSTRLLAG